MRDEVGEPAHALGMDLDVVSPRPPADGAVRPCERLTEELAHVLAELGGPCAAERTLQADDAVAVQAAHDRRDVVRVARPRALATQGIPLLVCGAWTCGTRRRMASVRRSRNRRNVGVPPVSAAAARGTAPVPPAGGWPPWRHA